MSQIDVLRPVATRHAGTGTAVPSGTLHGVTSDNSDSTYIQKPIGPTGSWSLRVGSHTPAAGHQRHQVRGRVRSRTDTGSIFSDIDLGRGAIDYIHYTDLVVTDVMTEYSGEWRQDAGFNLATAGALADLNIGGGFTSTVDSGPATVERTAECYVDIDCRMRPDFTPEVRDASGVDRTGDVVIDTTQPTLWYGSIALDDLPALDWAVVVLNAADVEVFSASGVGVAPASVPITVNLPNGTYTAQFTARSTIRGSDPFPHTISAEFEIDNVIPPPSPPLLEVIEAFGGYQLSWSNPGGQEWDTEMPLVAEVWRDDCAGSQRIATIPDGLNGSYLDLAIPQIDTRLDCEDLDPECPITYRVRYWGYVSTTVEIPDVLPVDLILAWPSTAASIPDGWIRVTELDGYYPRGAITTAAPTVTGGAASHSHTSPNHAHNIGAHSHGLGGNSTGSFESVNTRRRTNGDVATANQSHNHDLPLRTGTRAQLQSGFAAPGTSTVANDPLSRDVIWIRSDGTETSYPVGILGYSTQSVSGWTPDATSSGRFLKGAAAGGNGGALHGAGAHQHSVLAHTHTGVVHDHTIANTGLSQPEASTEADAGDSETRFLPRHTHPMNILITSTGSLISNDGGLTGHATSEPVHRRLRILRNTGGGAQTRIIGLYLGAVADLNPVLTLCDGRAGTPDMRGYFCRDMGSGSVNTTGGSNTHSHSVPTHTHLIPPHQHQTQIGTSNTGSRRRQSGGDQGSVPTTGHGHDSGQTFPTAPVIGNAGGGNTNTVSTLPPYREVHFVRVDGTVAGGDLPIPELRITEFATITVPALTHADGLDRISSLTDRMAIAPDRSSDLPRLSTDFMPAEGGLHSVLTSQPGEDLTLSIAVTGLPAINRLESILAARQIYWSPVGGTPGWFAPQGWSTRGPVPNTWVVQITMVRIPWPSTIDPEDLL